MIVTDMILQHVDSLLTARIRALARDRHCSVNEVMLHALRNGLGISAAQEFSETLRDHDALTKLEGCWENAEQGILQEAMRALARTPPTQFAPESIAYSDRTSGAE
jgi:hypothetical protein